MRFVPMFVVLFAFSCGLPVETPVAAAAAPLTTCVVEVPGEVTGVTANRDGVAFVRAREGKVLVERAQGVGCALSREAAAPIALESLLDLDDLGNVYGFSAEGGLGELSTMLPDGYPGSAVVKVDVEGKVTKLLEAGRGIWSFGVSPEGGTLWVTACGPTGVFAMDAVTPAMPLPETLWQQYPSVLTANGTFWSVGYRTCEWNEAMSPSCGFALVRSTAAGSRELGTTIADFGAGYEQATLARCGSAVCGMFPSAVIAWDDEGRAIRTILRSEIASDSERIVQVSGNQHGVYVVLERETARRIVFVPVVRAVGGHNR